METSKLVNRVNRGVKFLNQKRPGWHKEVKLTELDLYHPLHCLMGQLYGNFFNAMHQFGMANESWGGVDRVDAMTKGAKYGFSFSERELRSFRGDIGEAKAHKELTKVWKEAIHKLRKVS